MFLLHSFLLHMRMTHNHQKNLGTSPLRRCYWLSKFHAERSNDGFWALFWYFGHISIQRHRIQRHFQECTAVGGVEVATRHLPPNCTNFITYYQLYEFFYIAWYDTKSTKRWQMIRKCCYQASAIFLKI